MQDESYTPPPDPAREEIIALCRKFREVLDESCKKPERCEELMLVELRLNASSSQANEVSPCAAPGSAAD